MENFRVTQKETQNTVGATGYLSPTIQMQCTIKFQVYILWNLSYFSLNIRKSKATFSRFMEFWIASLGIFYQASLVILSRKHLLNGCFWECEAQDYYFFCASFYLSLSSPPGDESGTGSINGLSLKPSIMVYFLNIFCRSR